MGAIAIVDAAVFYGAQRILDGVKDERFRLNDDRELFTQFLHFVVLYDNLLSTIPHSRQLKTGRLS